MITNFSDNSFGFRKLLKVLTIWSAYFFFFKCTLFSQFIFNLLGETNSYDVLNFHDSSFSFVVFSIGIVFYFVAVAVQIVNYKQITSKYEIEDTISISSPKAEKNVFCLNLANPFLYSTKVLGLLE